MGKKSAFRHLYLLLGWPLFFLLYYLTETYIPLARCHLIHIPLDDRIPFREEFVIFYVGWYLLIVLTLGYFLLRRVASFKRLQTYIIIVQLLAVVVFILYPSRQALRPEAFPRQNLFTQILSWIYRIDTPTGVFPSLHVAISVGIASAWIRERGIRPWLKGGIVLFCLGVCASVTFVKQHSAADILAALPLCLIAELVAFGSDW